MATNVEVTKLLMGDCASAYTDDQIQIFLDETKVNGAENTKFAAALGLNTCANSEALLEALSKTLNWTEDNRGLADNLRKGAKNLMGLDANIPYSVDVQQNFGPFSQLSLKSNLEKEAGFGSI